VPSEYTPQPRSCSRPCCLTGPRRATDQRRVRNSDRVTRRAINSPITQNGGEQHPDQRFAATHARDVRGDEQENRDIST